MRLGVAAAAAMGTTAVTGSANAATARRDISFDRVVDAVDDLGWDPSGNQEISVPTDTGLLIEVPPGEYVFPGTGQNTGFIEGSLNRWGIRGLGEDPSDVVFRTSNGKSTYFINSSPSSQSILIENCTFDNTDARRGGDIGNVLRAQERLEVHDVDHVGFSGKEPYCRWSIYPMLTDSNGVGNVVNYRKTGPSVFIGHGDSDGAGGIFDGHVGSLTFRDCVIANQGGDGGWYHGKHNGSIVYDNCRFENNDMAAIRSGAGCELRNSTVIIDWDNAHPDNVIDDGHPPTGTNGVYFSTAEYGKSGGGIYNCDIIMKSTYDSGVGAIMINNSDGGMDIHDTRIQVDFDGMPAIWGGDPENQRFGSHKTPSRPWGLDIRNVSITGSGDMGGKGSIVLNRRHGSTVADSCIQAPNADGVCVDGASDCSIENTNINVGGRATMFRDTSVSTNGITQNDSCPVPNPSSPGDSTGDGSDGSSGSDGSDDEEKTDDGSGDDGSSDPADGTPRRLTVKGTGEYARYAVEVSGGLTSLEDGEETPEGASTVVGNIAGRGTDPYEFTGSVESFEFRVGEASLTLDGERVTPDQLVERTQPDDGSDDGGDSEFDGTGDRLVIEAQESMRYHVRGKNVSEAGDNEGPAPGIDGDDNGAYGALAAGQSVALALDSFGVVRLDPEGSATLTLDGDVIPPEEYGTMSTPAWEVGVDVPIPEDSDEEESGDDPKSNPGGDAGGRLVIAADANLRYHVRGKNVAEAADNEGPTPGIDVDDNGAYGALAVGQSVALDVDSFSVACVEPEDAATLTLDGDVISPEEYGTMSTPAWEVGVDVEMPALPENTLTLVSAVADPAVYQFTVDGAVMADPEKGSLEADDNVSGRSAEGAVADDVDSYRFSGDVTDFSLQGEAAVYLNGEQVSPELLGTGEDATLPNLIVVDGTTTRGRCDYEFVVDGQVEKSLELGSVEAEDTVVDGTVSGTVEGERDAYRFAGALTGFDMDGSATIRFKSN